MRNRETACPGSMTSMSMPRKRRRGKSSWSRSIGDDATRVETVDCWRPAGMTIRGLPSEVVLEPGDDPVPLRSAVNLDSVESVAIGVLTDRLGPLGDQRMRPVCAALAVVVDCD